MSLALNRGLDPHVPSPAYHPVVDRSFVVRRLLKNAISLVVANPKCDYWGPDPVVENVARAHAFASTELAILRISVGIERYTLVCAPEPVWFTRKSDLIKLKRVAAVSGRDCVLVPEGAIQRQPRLSRARVIEDAGGVHVSMEQRMSVLVHLIENGGISTLMDCACAIDHESPFSAILQLVSIGVLRVGQERGLTPNTEVELPDKLAG